MRNEPSASLRSGGIAPLQRRAVVSRRVSRPTRAAASGPNNTPNTWSSSPNPRSSQYSPTGGNLGNTRDLYEGATGLDVLAMQKDLVAEGFLGRQHATGYAPFSSGVCCWGWMRSFNLTDELPTREYSEFHRGKSV